MRVTIDGSGNIVTHGDDLSGAGVISFPLNEPPGFPTGWTVQGTAPSRTLHDPRNNEVAAEDTAGPGPSLPGASGDVGDSAFYDDTQGMVGDPGPGTASDLTAGVTFAWASGIEQVTGTDLALNADNTLIDVLTEGIYAVQLRVFVHPDQSTESLAFLVQLSVHSPSGGVGDLGLVAGGDVADVPFYLPMSGLNLTLNLVQNWVLHLPPCSIFFIARASRLDSSTSAIQTTGNGATEVLIRRVA